ncbi:MAG: hypothetical protein FJW90_00315 [Actinobacteria bacterium]|nr:hypothetical protein [Actinomycetota bacterium]
MAAECLCGCGREVAFRWRPVNTRGRDLRATVTEIKKTPGRGRSLADRGYVKEVNRACEKLAEAVHEQLPADNDLERETRDLLKKYRERYGKPGFSLGRWQIARR